jgi:transcriptional regulator with XRE-family HTH domain
MKRNRPARTSVLGTYLLGLLEKRNMTQDQLAEQSGVGAARISDMINKPEAEPRLSTFVKVATALDVPLRTLLDAAGYPIERVETAAEAQRRLALLLDAAPWMGPMMEEVAALPPDDQASVASFVRWHLDQRRKA